MCYNVFSKVVFLQQLVPVNFGAIDLPLKPPFIVGLELFAELNLLTKDRVDAVVHREELSLKHLLSLLSSTSPSVVPGESCSVIKAMNSSAFCLPSVVKSIHSRSQGTLLSL